MTILKESHTEKSSAIEYRNETHYIVHTEVCFYISEESCANKPGTHPCAANYFFFFVLEGITTCSNHLSLFNFIPISYILNLVGICTSYNKLCFCDSPRYMQVLLKNKRYVDSDVVSGSFHKTGKR